MKPLIIDEYNDKSNDKHNCKAFFCLANSHLFHPTPDVAIPQQLQEGLLHHRSQAGMGPPTTSAQSVLLAWVDW